MAAVLCERDRSIDRITLNRPDALSAIDGDMPAARVDADQLVHLMVLAGAEQAFCSAYDLA